MYFFHSQGVNMITQHFTTLLVTRQMVSGSDPGFVCVLLLCVFFLGGGGQNRCAHAHHEREARCPLQPYAVFYYLSLIFKHYDTKWDYKTY